MSLVVEVDAGRVAGVEDPVAGVRVFRGIPFAAPLRFSAPGPVRPWAGIRAASTFGPSPMQPAGGPLGGVIPGQVASVSEDCLTLNVWTPSGDPSGLPVLVWFYGGAYLIGGTCIPTYDAARLCGEQQLVVVSANYRVGAFGYLWLGGAAPNAGLLDQIAALEWVRRNASAFGGDPECVTAAGESAGAGSVLHLMSTPLSEGLFRRVICQSPGVDHTLMPEQAGTVTGGFLNELGLAPGPGLIDRLRDVPASALLDAQQACLPAAMRAVSSMPFHPVVDGAVLRSKPSAAIAAGAGSTADLLLTWTADEMRLFPNPRADQAGRDGLVRWAGRYLESRLGAPAPRERAAELVDFYLFAEASRYRPGGASAWAALQSDGIMRLPARRVAESRLGGQGSTFCGQFCWPAQDDPGGWQRGAFHAIDLPFVFGTLDHCGWREFLGADEDADALSSEMRSAWASFARTGVPAGSATGAWPRYTSADRATVLLDSSCSIAPDPLGQVDRLWDGLWSLDAGPPPGR